VFTAIVAHANGEPAQPWWVFSRQRKARDQELAHARPAATGSGPSAERRP
jgi:hypothetical protein